MGPGPSNFFFKLANPTAFSPQILTNTINPSVQLEYLREFLRPFHQKLSLKSLTHGQWALDPLIFSFKLANPTPFSPQILTNTITPCVQLDYFKGNWAPIHQKLSLKSLTHGHWAHLTLRFFLENPWSPRLPHYYHH